MRRCRPARWLAAVLPLAFLPFPATAAPAQTSIGVFSVRESPELEGYLASEEMLAQVTQQLMAALEDTPGLQIVQLELPGDLVENDELPTFETLVGLGRMAGCSGVVVTQLRVFDFEEDEVDVPVIGWVRTATSAVMLTGGLIDVHTGGAAAPTGGSATEQARPYIGPSPDDIDERPGRLGRSLLGKALDEAAAQWTQSVVDGLAELTPGQVEPPTRVSPPGGVSFGADEFVLDVNRGFDRRGVITLVNHGDQARSFTVRTRSADPDIAIGLKGEGSEDELGTLGPGQWKFVRVVVNVETDGERVIPLSLFTADEGEEPNVGGVAHDQVPLQLRVVAAPVDVHLARVGQDPHTLAYDYRIENRGDEAADLEIRPTGASASRIRFEPSMASLRLRPGEIRDFRVAPVLQLYEPVLEAGFVVMGGSEDVEEPLRFEIPPDMRLFYGTTSTSQGSSGTGGSCTNSGEVSISMGDVSISRPGENTAVYGRGGVSAKTRAENVGAWLRWIFGSAKQPPSETDGVGIRGSTVRPTVARYWPLVEVDTRDLPSVVVGTDWVATMTLYAQEGEEPAAWLTAFHSETGELRPELRLSEPDHNVRWPSLHVASDRDRAFVVWEDDQGGGSDVALRRSGDHLDNWNPVQYLTRHGGGVTDPVVMSRGELVVVAWQDERLEASRVLLRLSHDGGNSFGSEVELPAAESARQEWPQVALGDGVIDVAWVSLQGGQSTVVARRLDDQGQLLGDVAALSRPGASAGEPHVLVAGDSVVAAWREGDGADSEIWFRAGNGEVWQPAVQITDDDSYSEYPRLAPTEEGLAIFFHSDASGPTDLTYLAETRDGGMGWSPAQALPAISGKINKAWLTVRFGLQWPRSDYTAHDTFVHVNGVQVGALEQMVPEGVYVFEVPTTALAATAVDLGANVVTVTTEGMNQADYVELQEARLVADRAFTQVPVAARSQDEADRLASQAAADLNHAQPDLVVAPGYGMSYLPDEPMIGDSIGLSLQVHNLGQAVATGATIGVYAGDPSDPLFDLASAQLAVTSLADLVAGEHLDVDLEFEFDPRFTGRVFVAALVDNDFAPLDNSWGLSFSAGESGLPTPLFGTDLPDLFRAPGLLDSVRLPDVQRFEELLHLPSLDRWTDISLWREGAEERWKNVAIDRFEAALNERLEDRGLPSIDVRDIFARIRR